MQKNNKIDVIGNTEIMIIALWESGGTNKFIHVEDAYLSCYQISPSRFSWRTKKDIPDRVKLKKAMLNKKNKNPFIKQGAYEVRLSSFGINWIKKNKNFIAKFLEKDVKNIKFSPNASSKKIYRFRDTDFFQNWLKDPHIMPEKWELASAFRCSISSPTTIWDQRIQTLLVEAEISKDTEVVSFINNVLTEKPYWFDQEGRYEHD